MRSLGSARDEILWDQRETARDEIFGIKAPLMKSTLVGSEPMPCGSGVDGMPHVARFDPSTSGSSGMFVARIRKRLDPP